MKILGERVLLDWEVFNWLGYLGYSYIRIARPISPEFMKICSVPSALEESKRKENLNARQLPFFHLAGIELVYVKKLIVALVSGTLAMFTHNSLNSSLEGCGPVIDMSDVSQVCRFAVWLQQ